MASLAAVSHRSSPIWGMSKLPEIPHLGELPAGMLE